MGARQSTNAPQSMAATTVQGHGRTYNPAAASVGGGGAGSNSSGTDGTGGASTSAVRHANSRHRAISLGHVVGGHGGGSRGGGRGFPITIPHHGALAEAGAVGGGSPDSDDSTPEEVGPLHGRTFMASSLPVHLFSFRGEFRKDSTKVDVIRRESRRIKLFLFVGTIPDE